MRLCFFHVPRTLTSLMPRNAPRFSPPDRAALLKKIHKALKPGGRFITDVCSLRLYEDRPESTRWSYEEGGFWSEKPHACLHAHNLRRCQQGNSVI